MSNLDSGFTVADGSNIILVINAKLDNELREKLVHLIGFYLGEFDVTIGFSLGFSDPQALPTYITPEAECMNKMARIFAIMRGGENRAYWWYVRFSATKQIGK